MPATAACTQNIALKLTSVYETSHQDLQWGICTTLADSHGYSVGIMQFTTGTGSAQDVISTFEATLSANETSPFAQYHTALQTLKSQAIQNGGAPQGDISQLPNFCNAWATAANDTRFRNSQLKMVDKLYWNPSQKLVQAASLSLPISKAQIFDSSIQLGLQGTTDLMQGVGSIPDEKEWIKAFLGARRAHLVSMGGAYAPTVTRVASFEYIVEAGNFVFDNNQVDALNNDGAVMHVICDSEVQDGSLGSEEGGEAGGNGTSSGLGSLDGGTSDTVSASLTFLSCLFFFVIL
ncbi:lysozyme-like domain-containing protein [Chytriomyces sp. MP71]|nr:lysozyme-like domain-containing protein [Chytriomyces sp. MP71]